MAPKCTKAQKTADAAKTVKSAEVTKSAEPSSGSASTDQMKAQQSLKNWFRYAAKEGSDDAKKWAEVGRAEYKACNPEDKFVFLEKFMATKDNKNKGWMKQIKETLVKNCLLYTSPSPRDLSTSRMPSSA